METKVSITNLLNKAELVVLALFNNNKKSYFKKMQNLIKL